MRGPREAPYSGYAYRGGQPDEDRYTDEGAPPPEDRYRRDGEGAPAPEDRYRREGAPDDQPYGDRYAGPGYSGRGDTERPAPYGQDEGRE